MSDVKISACEEGTQQAHCIMSQRKNTEQIIVPTDNKDTLTELLREIDSLNKQVQYNKTQFKELFDGYTLCINQKGSELNLLESKMRILEIVHQNTIIRSDKNERSVEKLTGELQTTTGKLKTLESTKKEMEEALKEQASLISRMKDTMQRKERYDAKKEGKWGQTVKNLTNLTEHMGGAAVLDGWPVAEDSKGAALFIIDPQNDFHEGGSLAVEGATADSKRISDLILLHSPQSASASGNGRLWRSLQPATLASWEDDACFALL